MKTLPQNTSIAIVGLGYVGLPLAVEFGKKIETVGFDICEKKIEDLKTGVDQTGELDSSELALSHFLKFTNDKNELTKANFFIVAVPTPLDLHNKPDLSALFLATKIVGACIKPGDIVVYESTVYPGATEEDCVPILEEKSGLKFNQDFYCGYSPERVNPGDKNHRLKDIVKVTSGSTPEVAILVDILYREIITAGTYMAESIKVAEAAKVIENTQRDLNIALINELAIIFNKLEIDTSAVLRAAGTKWNFSMFKPGLVGGHCISVDPYYLTHKSQSIGYEPKVILAGRRVNDGMGEYIARVLVKAMVKRGCMSVKSRVLILGFSFKENCRDIRNTRVMDVYEELQSFGIEVEICDPLVNSVDVYDEYGIKLIDDLPKASYDAVLIAVAHDLFLEWGSGTIRDCCKDKALIYDLKRLLPDNQADLYL